MPEIRPCPGCGQTDELLTYLGMGRGGALYKCPVCSGIFEDSELDEIAKREDDRDRGGEDVG
jgi:hypothetical protein